MSLNMSIYICMYVYRPTRPFSRAVTFGFGCASEWLEILLEAKVLQRIQAGKGSKETEMWEGRDPCYVEY